MIKKTITFIWIFFLLFFSLKNSYGYNSNVTIVLKNSNWIDINWKVIQINYLTEKKKLLTNKGKINFEIDFNKSNQNRILIIINWNSINSDSFWEENLKITIIYNEELEKIEKVIWLNWEISNQEIITLTNYKILILFIFFTLLSFTILFWWRLTYNLMYQDIDKYK